MPTVDQISSTRLPSREQDEAPVERLEPIETDEEELSEYALRAIEEGRADQEAGRTFTLEEVERELKRWARAGI